MKKYFIHNTSVCRTLLHIFTVYCQSPLVEYIDYIVVIGRRGFLWVGVFLLLKACLGQIESWKRINLKIKNSQKHKVLHCIIFLFFLRQMLEDMCQVMTKIVHLKQRLLTTGTLYGIFLTRCSLDVLSNNSFCL